MRERKVLKSFRWMASKKRKTWNAWVQITTMKRRMYLIQILTLMKMITRINREGLTLKRMNERLRRIFKKWATSWTNPWGLWTFPVMGGMSKKNATENLESPKLPMTMTWMSHRTWVKRTLGTMMNSGQSTRRRSIRESMASWKSLWPIRKTPTVRSLLTPLLFTGIISSNACWAWLMGLKPMWKSSL